MIDFVAGLVAGLTVAFVLVLAVADTPRQVDIEVINNSTESCEKNEGVQTIVFFHSKHYQVICKDGATFTWLI